MNQLAAQATGLIYGPGPFQDHHGGALWLHDGQGWFMGRNQAGIEWSAQFCADPAKVDLLRHNAKRLYDLVAPQLKQQLDPDGLLDTPIQDAAGVAKWTDSIFNAGVPLHPSFHTGVLPGDPAQPSPDGAQAPPAAAAQVAPPAGAQAPPAAGAQAPPAAGAQAPPAAGPQTPPASANSEFARGASLPHACRRHSAVQVRRLPVVGHRPGGQPGSGRARSRARQQQRQRQRALRHARLAAGPAKHAAERAGVPLILPPGHPLSVQAYKKQPRAGSGGAPAM